MKSRKFMGLMAAALLAGTVAGAPARAQVPSNTAWEGKTIPLELFGQFPTVSTPRISPDGSMLLARVRAGGLQALALIPLAGGGKPQVIARDDDFSKDKQGAREIVGWRWIDNENILITLRSRDNYMGDWYDNIRLVAFNRKTEKAIPLGWENAGPSAGNVLWMTPPGTPNPRLLLSRQAGNSSGSNERVFRNPEVVEIEVETGKMRPVVPSTRGVSNWTADEAGVVRFGSSFDGDSGQVQIKYRANADEQFRTIVRERRSMHSDTIVPSIILSGSDKAYALSNHEGYRALYEYDLTGMDLGKKVFGVDGYDISGASTTVDGKALQAYHWTAGRDSTLYLDPRLKEIFEILEEMFGKGNVQINSADRKREKLIFTASELGQVPGIYMFDTVSGRVSRVAWYNDQLQNAKLNPVSVIRYPASDGKQIEAILTMPRHKAGQKNLPVIVLPHGGPWARDAADWDPFLWAQALAEWGYVVIQPNYRGSSGYGLEWSKASDGNWGYRMQDDLNDAVTWLAGKGIGDPKRVCMMGWSYGGYAASRAAQRDGAKYRCTISGAGVHDLPEMVAYDRDYLGPYMAKQALGAAGQLRDVSPGLHPEQYSTPILIVHGAKDQRVPVAQSRGLVSRLRGAGKKEGVDYVYLEQPLNTHNLLREEDRIQLLREVKKFLDRHNPA